MSNLNRQQSGLRTTIAIALASTIALLAGFVGGGGAQAPGGDPDFAAGQAVGSGIAYGLVIWAAGYFLLLRKSPVQLQVIGGISIVGFAIAGVLVRGAL